MKIVITTKDNGTVTLSEYGREFDELIKHSHDDKPAAITYDDEGKIVSEIWAKDNKIHRDVMPAIIAYKNGEIFLREWWKDDTFIDFEGGVSVIDK